MGLLTQNVKNMNKLESKALEKLYSDIQPRVSRQEWKCNCLYRFACHAPIPCSHKFDKNITLYSIFILSRSASDRMQISKRNQQSLLRTKGSGEISSSR